MTEKREPDEARSAARRRLWMWAGGLLGLTLLSGIWALPPVQEWIEPQRWLALLGSLREHPAAPWAVMGAFLVGTVLVLPVTIMVVLAIALLGPVEGFFYALGGTTLSAILMFAVGRGFGRQQLDHLVGSRLHDVSVNLRRAGITTVAAVRLFPLTHFTVVSLMAGVSHIRVRDYIAGTVLGMAPGIGAIAVFFDQLSSAAAHPNGEHLLWLGVISVAMMSVLLGLRRVARPRD